MFKPKSPLATPLATHSTPDFFNDSATSTTSTTHSSHKMPPAFLQSIAKSAKKIHAPRELVIWGAVDRGQLLTAISPSLRAYPALKVHIETCPMVGGNFLGKSLAARAVPEFNNVVVLGLGNGPKDALEGAGLISKGRTITSLRKTPLELQNGTTALLSYSAGILEVDYGKYVDLLTDVGAAVRLASTGSLYPALGSYKYVTDLSEPLARVDALFAETGRPVEATLDLETIGLDPYAKPHTTPSGAHPGSYIVTVQVSVEVGVSYVVYFESANHEESSLTPATPIYTQLHEFLNSPKISLGGANLKFDTHWLWVRAKLRCTNFKFDTTLVGSLLDENRSNGLDIHAKIYAPELGGYSDVFDKTVDKGRMDLVSKEQLLPYAGGDTDACLRVRKAMKTELLKDPELTKFYVTILHPASRAFELIEQGGVCIDKAAYHTLEDEVTADILRLTSEAKKILGGRLVIKHGDDTKTGGINITKAELLSDYMFSPQGLNLKPKMYTEKTGAPSSALEHMLMFADVPAAKDYVALLKDYGSASKVLSTYITGFKKHLRTDGRYHPSYYFFVGDKSFGDGGAVSGRLSCNSPAFQTLPKKGKWGKPIRKCFTAPPGYLVSESDYAQGELKVIACVASEETMIGAFSKGLDMHLVSSVGFSGLSIEDLMQLQTTDEARFSSIRQLGKLQNFALLYGMSAASFRLLAQTDFGVVLTLAEATAIRDKFFATYPRLVAYYARYKAHAHKYGNVRSPLGRLRRLPLINSKNSAISALAERQAINSPIQSTLSDMLLWAIARASETGLTAIAPCFGAIHDAKYTYVPEDRADECLARDLELMENLPFAKIGWNPQLRFTADTKIGRSMGELKNWKPS